MKKSFFLNFFDKFPLIPFLDYFVYNHFHHDNDTLYRARIMAGIVFFNIFTILLTPIFIIIPSKGNALITALITLPLAFIFLCVLFILRRYGQYTLCCNIIVFTGYLSTTVGIIFTGGATKAPAIQVSFIPAVMMFCLGGMKPGFIWTFIVIITQFSLVGLSRAGVTFPQVLDSSEMGYNMILDWFIALSAIIATIVIYEYLNLRLKWERDKEHEKYVFMAKHDPLTELPNRTLFAYTLERAFGRANRANKKVALFFLDLDGFKPVNDNFGHEIGDIVLVNIANILKTTIRNTDTAARIGGDEFAVILEGITDSESVKRVADKILLEIALPMKVDGHIINVTGSIGVAFYPDHAQDIDTIRKFADMTMYRAKQNQNAWFIYDGAEIPNRSGQS